MKYNLRQKIGVLIFDWPKFARRLLDFPNSLRHPQWVEICNRNESLERAPEGPGVLCLWKWTTDLHAPKVFPLLGLRLMRKAFRNWPVVFRDEPLSQSEDIRISFIIGHRGAERLPHLHATLRSIAAQRNISFECIVVEQSASREIETSLPSWVRYIYTPLPYPDMPYCRSWAFNVGARTAEGMVLIFHDNDMLVPEDYAEQVMRRYQEGYEFVDLKRFIFYFSEAHSERVCVSKAMMLDEPPEAIMQNADGGTVAASKKAFIEIGGYDESFIGWGGEDNEFWERAKTRKIRRYGYMPLGHLWHKAQSEKTDQKRATAALFEERLRIPVETRIKELCSRMFGNPVQLSGSTGHKSHETSV